MNKKLLWITLYAITACSILYMVEHIFTPSYILIIVQKVLLFIIIPLIILYSSRRHKDALWNMNKKSIFYGVVFWVLASITISWSYLIFQSQIDWQSITTSLRDRWITQEVFLFVFAYIMFGNALIEEFFFRGFVFQTLKRHLKIFAYIFSALLFSLYHIAIFGTWFDGIILVIALIWLFLWGLFFSFLYEKTNGIWAAYIFHIIADGAILIIGYQNLF